MKIVFILPAIGKKPGQPYIKTWQTIAPLTISLLKALTPAEHETLFFDDRRELIDYDVAADLVAITCEFYTALRAYRIAARFRERGIPVVMGGYHPTLCPDEVAKHADSVIRGNAETVWEKVLADYAAGTPARHYTGAPEFKRVLPDTSIFAGRKYATIMAVSKTFFICLHLFGL